EVVDDRGRRGGDDRRLDGGEEHARHQPGEDADDLLVRELRSGLGLLYRHCGRLRSGIRTVLTLVSGARNVEGEQMPEADLAPFEVVVTAAEVADLRRRLAATRWPEIDPDPAWA